MAKTAPAALRRAKFDHLDHDLLETLGLRRERKPHNHRASHAVCIEDTSEHKADQCRCSGEMELEGIHSG